MILLANSVSGFSPLASPTTADWECLPKQLIVRSLNRRIALGEVQERLLVLNSPAVSDNDTKSACADWRLLSREHSDRVTHWCRVSRRRPTFCFVSSGFNR